VARQQAVKLCDNFSMDIISIKKEIQDRALKKFERIMSLCHEKSPIEKKFVGNLYYFFLRNGLIISDVTIPMDDTMVLENNGLRSIYYLTNDRGQKIELSDEGQYVNPLTREIELLIGFQVQIDDLYFKILPQYPVFDKDIYRIIDVAILVSQKDGKRIGQFGVECDGFNWHNTLRQLTADNRRTRFLTFNSFTIIRYTGAEINAMADRTIINLINLIHNNLFGEDSNACNFWLHA